MFLFCKEIVFYLEQFYCSKGYAYSIIDQHEKCTLHRTQGITRPMLDGESHLACFYLCLHFFLLQVACFCNLFIKQMRCRHPWIVCFFQKKVTAWNLWREEEDWEKLDKEKVQFQHYGRWYEEEGKNFLPKIEKAFSWLQLSESKQTTSCSVHPRMT